MLGRLLRSTSKSKLVTFGSVGLFVATTLVNVSSFAYHLIASRQLSPDEYGALGALVGILVVLAVPSAALQVVITRQVAAREADPDGNPVPVVVGPLLANATIFGLVTTALLLVCAPLVERFLHLPTLTSAVLLAVFVLPITIELVPKAVLLGEFKFGQVAIALVAGASVRLALAYPLTNRSGVDGAMAATVLGGLVTPAILLPSLRRFIAHQPEVEPLRIHLRDGAGALSAFTGYWMLVTADTVLARHFMGSVQSGLYAAASLAARSVMFLPGAIAMIAFPRFAKGGGHSADSRQALVHSLGIVSAIGVAAALVFVAAPGFILGSLFPSAYSASSDVVGMLAFSAAAVGSVGVLMHYHLATRARLAAGFSWIAVVIIGVGIALFHDSLIQVATVTLATNVFLLVIMAIPVFGPGSRPQPAEYDSRELWDLPTADRDLTLVVPFYNPGPLLRANLERVLDVLQKDGVAFEIIAVSDGSTDKSDVGLEDFGDVLRVVRLEKNQGKGAALRVGLARARGRYVGFIDADGDILPTSLHEFVELIRLYEPDIILGSKRHPMSELHYPILRHVYSWGYQQMVRGLFRLNLRDTQTGLKMVRRDVLADVLPRMVEKRFAFDLELFVVARHLGHRRFFEAPVRIQHQFTSTVSWRAVIGTLQDTLGIFYRLHVLRFYDQVASRPAPSSLLPPNDAGTQSAPERKMQSAQP